MKIIPRLFKFRGERRVIFSNPFDDPEWPGCSEVTRAAILAAEREHDRLDALDLTVRELLVRLDEAPGALYIVPVDPVARLRELTKEGVQP